MEESTKDEGVSYLAQDAEVVNGVRVIKEVRLQGCSLIPEEQLINPECRIIADVKHDGKLDKRGDYAVGYSHVTIGMNTNYSSIYGKGVAISGVDDLVSLTAQEALSLLAWLKQEQGVLEKLAKEQEG